MSELGITELLVGQSALNKRGLSGILIVLVGLWLSLDEGSGDSGGDFCLDHAFNMENASI